LEELMSKAEEGDDLVFTYSGHGSWLPDDDGDEVDGRDEMLCPHDVSSGQYLMDDDLAEIFARKPAGARLYFISDSCHSGSVAKMAPPLADAQVMRPRLLPPGAFVKDPEMLDRIRRAAPLARASRQKYPALLLSGCKDVEVSFDGYFDGRPNGALSRVAIDALESSAPESPREWHQLIREKLPSIDYPQTPQLYGSRSAKRGPLF
jgi:hypothetical protein